MGVLLFEGIQTRQSPFYRKSKLLRDKIVEEPVVWDPTAWA